MKTNKMKIATVVVLSVLLIAALAISATLSTKIDSVPGAVDGNVALEEQDVPTSTSTTILQANKNTNYDVDGNLLVPFDIANKEFFESGSAKYDESTFLIKLPNSISELTKEYQDCGIEKMESFMQSDNDTWWKATIRNDADIKESVQAVRKMDTTLLAEYNYIYETADYGTMEEVTDTECLDNPEIIEQKHLGVGNGQIQRIWKYLKDHGKPKGGSSDVVVAVIDTGVDYTHRDLIANIWTNVNEIPGNGRDDDGNGYVDDVHGVNVVGDSRFHSGNPMDDHGHGTHVAGIIAASNNKEGIIGIAYNTKIMAIKAAQSSGVLLQADIAEAILYAYNNGADVINMSFGGPSCSIAVQDALNTAYTRCVLVASAGNDGLPNEYVPGWLGYQPNYPAALSYVIGVMSVDNYGRESAFTNWDVKAYNSVEYEVYAPGEQILSTIPGNKYAKWSGTSMSAPYVSAVAALLRSLYNDRDMYPSKFIYGQICATSEMSAVCTHENVQHNTPMLLDAYSAMSKLPKPDVTLYNYYLFDSKSISDKNNGDGIVDNDETIYIGLVLRNRWGMSKNTIVTIDANSPTGIPCPYVTFVNSQVNFEGVGTYSTKDTLSREGSVVTGVETPLIVKINKNCPNDYLININVHISCQNAIDHTDHATYAREATVVITVRNGCILPNIISEDMTLTKDNYYIIPNATIIEQGATVTVEPGTKIQFWTDDPNDPYADTAITYLKVDGQFITQGTVEEPVKLFPSELMGQYGVEIYKNNNGYVSLNNTEVTNGYLTISDATQCTFNKNHQDYAYYRRLDSGRVETVRLYQSIAIGRAEECVFYKVTNPWRYYCYGRYERCIFVDSAIDLNEGTYSSCVFLGNYFKGTSSISLSQSGYSINSVYRDNETGRTYVVCSTGDMANIDMLRIFAQEYGGELACFETKQEYLKVNENIRIDGYYLGIVRQNNKNYWINGQEVSDDYSLGDSKIETKYAYSQSNSIIYASTYNKYINGRRFYDYYVLLEFPGSIYVDNISLPESSVDMDMESTYQMMPSLLPVTASLDDLVYYSDDEAVVTVDENGLITPHSVGKATITVYSKDYQVSTRMSVVVKEKVVLTDITVKADKTQLSTGETMALTIEYAPKNTTEKGATFVSRNTSVATVSANGLITAVSNGTATITITAANEIVRQITITVVEPVTEVKFDSKFYVTSLDQEEDDLALSVLPLTATNRNVVWESSNESVAYVNAQGKLVKLANGNATLRATAEGTDLYDEVTVCVTPSYTASEVVKMMEHNGITFAMLGNHTLWAWGGDKKVPTQILDGVYDYIIGNNNSMAVLKDGSIQNYQFDNYNVYQYYFTTWNSAWLSYTGTNVAALERGGGYYLLTKDGTVFAKGINQYGQLGDGTTVNRDNLVQVGNLTDIVKIAATGDYAVFLDNAGNLYATGRKTGSQNVLEPELFMTGVADITKYGERIIVHTTAGNYELNSYYFSNKTSINQTIIASYENYYQYKIIDGYVYGRSQSSDYYGAGMLGNGEYDYHNDFVRMLKVENAKRLFVLGRTAYVQTTDGKFFAVGYNANGQLCDGTTTNRAEPNRLFFGLEETGGFVVESTNISNGFNDTSLVIDMSGAMIKSGSFSSIELKKSDNTLVSMRREVRLDKIILTPFATLAEGETYRLKIPANAVVSKFGTGNTALNYTFTTYVSETALALESQTLETGAVIRGHAFAAELAYSYAKRGDNYGQIKVLNEQDAEQTVVITLDRYTLKVNGTLAFGDYRLVIPAGALVDNVGGENEETVIAFSMVDAILLETASHCDGDHRVDEREDIVLTYSTAKVGDHFGEIVLKDSDGQTVACSVTVTDSILTISPTSDLAQGATYTLIVPEGALKDDLGNACERYEATFDTYAPLQLIRSSIADGQENVYARQEIRFFYNYAEQGENFAEIALSGESGAVACTVALSDNVLSVTPNTALSYDSQYMLTIPVGAVVDERGVQNEETSIAFTTCGKTDRFFYTVDYLNAEYTAWNNEHWYNSKFFNNAILNNFNDTNVEHWLRLQAPDGSGNIGAGGNYWGTTDSTLINKQIIDFDDYMQYQNIREGTILTTAPEDVWPFVVDAYVLNSHGERVVTVGKERVTFVVEFNRDMDVTIPLTFRFGSSYPYGEYMISGEYKTARRWEAEYTIKTTIENGNQRFTISNGRAADNAFMTLYECSYGRFGFEIDTTSAQALIMQGDATDTGISLSWTQDDFDTLIGYNVYRSTLLDGQYTKLNSYVIPFDEMTFFDDTVEPAKTYYYNFTVVKSDLSESTPSGKIVIMSKDTMAPNIYHTPIRTAYTNNNLVVSATITDNLQINKATLYYRVKGGEWKSVLMTAFNSSYTALIGAENISTDGLEYYLDAFDGISHTYKGTADNPYSVIVKQAIDKNDYGDVDGDGVITTKDALMLLKAANDLLNLTEDQFVRADLNGDGQLSAAEAMRILQYVSGKVTTIIE